MAHDFEGSKGSTIVGWRVDSKENIAGVDMPFRIGGFVSEEQAVAAPMQIAGLLLKANSAGLLPDNPAMGLSVVSNFTEQKSLCCDDPPAGLTDSLWGENAGEEPNSVKPSKENHSCGVFW
ncbi:hypothetical protein Ancab_017956 [Ancistrocladus abbreviatus]